MLTGWSSNMTEDSFLIFVVATADYATRQRRMPSDLDRWLNGMRRLQKAVFD
jgi:hypothetical protein